MAGISLGDLGDVNLAGIAADDILYWNAVAGEWQPIAMWIAAHAASHELGGGDDINVAGLSGQLADAQTPKAHKDSHDPQDGADKLDTAAPGAINAAASSTGVAHSFARSDHNHQHTAALHQAGGDAVINVAGLSGVLADPQVPIGHHTLHEEGNADALANAIAIAAMANLTNTKIWQGDAGNRPVEVAMPAAGPNFASGSYTGNGVDDRQITTGFICKCVLILNQGISSVDFFPVLNPTGADTLDIRDTDSVDDQEKPYLHASDGFVLGGAANKANGDGESYKYVAFG